ncbi:MAG: Replicative DNA helicase [Parcubacteria group bacterium GW2011_GWB1_41_6]|nr:MAG: Replicative DNA helicase [Parcubacteria group bacterium GW2011_GWB1_41_6]KKS34002.1 MAG: Replicative DNA helicase [Parcubacteria group bacterium GW2011_GWC2_42_13]
MANKTSQSKMGAEREFTSLGTAVRMPPQNLEAEMSVLGSLMLDKNAVLQTADVLTPEDFYRRTHQIIYEAMFELFKKNEPIDILSVSARLKEKGQLDDVDGHAYLAQLVNSVPTASNIGHYAEIVRQKSLRRRLIEASNQIQELGYQEEQNIEDVIDRSEKTIFGISTKSLKQRFIKVKYALEEAWERIDSLKSSDQLRGIPTGFAALDHILAGLQKSDLIILAARPSLGKTSLALDIARNAACNYNIPVGIFSLEMSTQQLIDRFIASTAFVDLWKLRTGRLSTKGDDFLRIRDAMEKLSNAPIFIDDEASSNILQMRAMARRLQAEHGLGLLIVDYLQLMMPRRETDSMVQQITEISRSLKALAKELNVPVLAISQLSRAVEQRHPPVPRLSDLRDSGSIEQDADVVAFIYREDKYRENSERQNVAEILIEKHRNGPTGKIELYFNPEKVSFTDIAKE